LYKIVLLRHGESLWNKENKFTGWHDVDLSEKGVQEAKDAGLLLKKEGFIFDIAFTSVLKRAIKTLWLSLEEMDQMWIPVKRSWRLNERHYGDLQGLNKSETTDKFGKDQVFIWRRSYDTPPPALDISDPRHPSHDLRYSDIDNLPASEALLHCKNRVLPYWQEQIVPAIKSGQKVLIVAHGNSLRALVKHLDNISDNKISELNIPTGSPLVYELDEDFKPIRHYYLGNEDEIQAKAEAVANQASSK